jgi:hypothetical protein
MPAETFARLLVQALDDSRADQGATAETKLSADELDEWLTLFGSGDPDPRPK